MRVKSYSVVLYLAAFLSQAGVGSCFLSFHHFSSHRPSAVSHVASSSSDLTGMYDGDTYDDGDNINIDSSCESTFLFNSDTDEDNWIQNAIDKIHNDYLIPGGQPLYDTSFDDPRGDQSIINSIKNDMDNEIAMLVRCNESPDSLLIEGGRALPPLSVEEMNDVSQLVAWNNGVFEATEFLKFAVSKIFQEHATNSLQDGILSMNPTNIASWMTKSLRGVEKRKVGQHDRRVLQTLSDFGEYGSGRLVEENLQDFYLQCIVGETSNLPSLSVQRHLELRVKSRDAVFRDIRVHGIRSPVEEEHLLLLEKINDRNSESTMSSNFKLGEHTFVDECEILDWDYKFHEERKNDVVENNIRRESSHRLVEMANDQKTPLRIRDGDFIFIDEESCIGCMQCANIAPSSFLMMESGRARTFCQRVGGDVEQAVDACPVSCMHRISFQELSAFETARDEGGATPDSSFRGSHIPLHVAGIASDNNRRSSWYHTLKSRCLMSSSCPQKGCYDCPSYKNPGENPYFIAKHKQAEHIRAQHFIESGEANEFRKTVDL